MKTSLIILFSSCVLLKLSLAVNVDIKINSGKLNVKKPIVLITHGLIGNEKVDGVKFIEAAYKSTKKYNVVTVDWRQYSVGFLIPHYYKNKIGETIAKWIVQQVNDFGFDPDNIILVGYSYGAHIMGSAARQANEIDELRRMIGRIVALDPSIPFLLGGSWLSKNDAKIVEVVHTDGLFGIEEPIGHVNFYPNGGVKQPGCSRITVNPNELVCNHARSYTYYAEAIRNPGSLLGVKCESYDSFLNQSCQNKVLSMGFSKDNVFEEGSYYLKTNLNKPFGMGNKGISP